MKVRKKPIIIDAYQVPHDSDTDTKELPSWVVVAMVKGDIKLIDPIDKTKFSVKSKEGWVSSNQGAYIMRGIEGELYICSEDIFNKTYDVLGE